MENYMNLLQSVKFVFKKHGKYKAMFKNDVYTITCRDEQMYCFVSGQAEAYVGNNTLEMYPGHIYYFPKGTLIRAKIIKEVDYCFIGFDFPLEVKSLLVPLKLPNDVDCTGELAYLPEHFCEFCNNQEPDLSQMIKANACMQRILAELIKDIELGNDKTRRLATILAYIEDNISEKISIKELADSMNLCEAYFSCLFKETVGMSPKQYVLKKKIDFAIDLMHDDGYTIGEVAAMVGFSDNLYFSRVFKEKTGFSPYQFKKLISDGEMIP